MKKKEAAELAERIAMRAVAIAPGVRGTDGRMTTAPEYSAATAVALLWMRELLEEGAAASDEDPEEAALTIMASAMKLVEEGVMPCMAEDPCGIKTVTFREEE